VTFLEKIAPVVDFRRLHPPSVRADRIPCEGIVRPVAAKRALLLGDVSQWQKRGPERLVRSLLSAISIEVPIAVSVRSFSKRIAL